MKRLGSVIEYEDWYQRIISPIRQALYTNECPDAQQALAKAWHLVGELELSPDTLEVVRYALKWYEFQVSIQGKEHAGCGQYYIKACAEFVQEAKTPAGEIQRKRLLTVLRCTGRLFKLDGFPREELDELLQGLPDVEDDEVLWHSIAGWAFAAREIDLLEKAYEVMLTRPSNLLGQAKWQRVNIMLLLCNGKARRLDVAETIKGMVVLPQVIEFRQLIWPLCVEQGLTDSELEVALEEAWERIKANPPVPRLEPRTKRMRS